MGVTRVARATLGLALGLAIGAACRVGGIPVPAPEALVGALLVLALTLGYVTADRLLAPDPRRPRRPDAAPGAGTSPERRA